MTTNKRQHFVAQSYLRAWCDPSTPAGQKPYVWRFNKDGSDPRRKAPENIFYETDMYTINRADGARDLVLERGLAGLESEFVAIRDSKLSRREQLTTGEHVLLCAFIAAAQARTPAHRDHQAAQWSKILERMDKMKEWAKTATPEQKRRASSFARVPDARGARPRLGYEDVKRLAEKPMQTMLAAQIRASTPLLARLDLLVLNSAGPAFITSDYPCVWFDPEGHKRPPLFDGPALMYDSIKISLPVSPRQLIVLHRRGITGYIDVPENSVDRYNRRTRFECSEYFVTNSNATKPIWFDPGVEPEDSWRKRNPESGPLRGPFDPPPTAR